MRDNTNPTTRTVDSEPDFGSPSKPISTDHISVADVITQSDSPTSISSPVVQVHHRIPLASQFLNFLLAIRNFFLSSFTLNLIAKSNSDTPTTFLQSKFDQMQLDFHKFTKEAKESFELREMAFSSKYRENQDKINKIIIENNTVHTLNQVYASENERLSNQIKDLETLISNNAEQHKIDLDDLRTDCDQLKDQIAGTNELFKPKFTAFQTMLASHQRQSTSEINQLKVTLNQLSSTASTLQTGITNRTSTINNILEEKDELIQINKSNISSNSTFNKQLQEQVDTVNEFIEHIDHQIAGIFEDVMALTTRTENIEKNSQFYLKTKEYNEIKAKDYTDLKSYTNKSITFVENDLQNLKLELEGLNLKIDNLPKYSPTDTKSVTDTSKSNDNHNGNHNNDQKKQNSIKEDDEESLGSLGSTDDAFLGKVVADPLESNEEKPALTEINEPDKSPKRVPVEEPFTVPDSPDKIEFDDFDLKDVKSFTEDPEID